MARVNNQMLERMAALRRDGFTMRAIAEEVGVSERTVRRCVRGVKAELRKPSERTLDDLVADFYDQVFETRRALVTAASELWHEEFDLDIAALDAALKSLRDRLAMLDKVSLRRLIADESIRSKFLQEFMDDVVRRWGAELTLIRCCRQLRAIGGAIGAQVDGDALEPPRSSRDDT